MRRALLCCEKNNFNVDYFCTDRTKSYRVWKAKHILVPQNQFIKKWEELILTNRKKGSSLGAVIEVRVSNCPVGIGEPIYQKLDSELSKAIMSINAVKGIEFGTGFDLVNYDGTNGSDQINFKNKKINFKQSVKFS